ncbi:MAG: transglutaminase family protein [Flavobacteriales bacterium]|nr:transglutaminase family protein [Flavobacteriales bacterium]
MMDVEGQARSHQADGSVRAFNILVVLLAAIVLTMPLFVVVYPHVPVILLPFGDRARIDHIVTFLIIAGCFYVLLRKMRLVLFALLILGGVVLTWSSFTGRYRPGDLVEDYRGFLFALRDNTVFVPLSASRLKPFENADMIGSRIDHEDARVRTFAVRAATMHFTEALVAEKEVTMVQAFSVFKVINGSWSYVNDVKGGEYFARASESVELLAGDCDDHAILMAACIKAIGGEVRLVRTVGHLYPELLIGDAQAMERVAYLLRNMLFRDHIGSAPLFYHTDMHGQRWINLDYTRNYPGGEVMDEKIVGILPV